MKHHPSLIRDWRGVPASRIDVRLWQSGLPNQFTTLPQYGIDVAVLAASDAQPGPDELAYLRRVCPSLSLICAPLDDVEDAWALPGIVKTATEVAQRVKQRLDEGKRVLVICQAGRNRSGLISALTLIARLGISGMEAVSRVRAARDPMLPTGERALTNDAFREYLETIPARTA